MAIAYDKDTGLSYNPNERTQTKANPQSTSPVTYNKDTGLSYNPNPVANENLTDLPEGVVPGYGDYAGSVVNQASNLEEPSYGLQTNEETAKQFAGGKTITNRVTNADGSITIIYSDGTSEIVSGTNILPKSVTDTSATDILKQQQQAERVSAFNILKEQFTQYGLGSLVDKLTKYMTDGTPASEFSLKLQQEPEYQKRFAANADRIKAGLSALTPAQYIAMEDQYQSLMRNYGLPASYYAKDDIGTQAGFQKLLASDVSAAELEDRIATAQQRVMNTNPEVLKALKQFYPDLGNADILAYTLDPQNALSTIKRKVSAAEIGGAALAQGLQAQGGTAESLAGMGITKAQAQQGYTDIAGLLPRASQLSDIYNQGPYNQGTAEAEVFNTAGAADAAAKRKKLSSLETASFSGQSGVGALGRDKNLYGQAFGQQGQY
jgi:hypothetical protein